MILAIDTATPQRYLNFAMPIAEGYTHIYVKNGGDNVDPTYESPYYDEQIDKARYMGYKKIGHYWVPNADPSDADDIDTPVQQADYMIANLRNWNKATDFIVLDNESLDGALRFNDAQTAEFIERVKSRLEIPGIQVMTYSGLNDARTTQWPLTLAAGTNFIIAAYSYPPFGWPEFSSIPAHRIVGHQTGGRIFAAVPGAPEAPTKNGVPTDINTFKDYAFDFGGFVPLNNYVLRSPATVILEDRRDPYVSWQNHLDRTAGLRGGVDIVAPIGTPVYARTAGVMLHLPNDGTAGNSSRFRHDANPGWEDVFSHLSRYVGVSGQHFEAGEIVAYTGISGGVAPHLHWHLLDPGKVRRNPWNYFSGSDTAGGGYTPIEEEDMPLTPEDIQKVISGLLNYPAYDGAPSLSQVVKDIHSDASNLYHGSIGAGGPDMPDHGKSIAQSVADLAAKPAAIVTLTDAQIDALATKVAAKLPAGSKAPTVSEISAGVRAAFKAEPLD
jgi:murein DD-endopeptidase MepM/ murein hydrolase activator NlpD